MKRISTLLFILLVYCSYQAQETFPSNGAPVEDNNLYVLKGAVMLSELKNAPLNTPFHKAYVSKITG